MRNYILILFTLILVCCNKKSNPIKKDVVEDPTLKILTYGLPDFNRSRASNTVAKKYGFTYYAVAGCLVTQELLDSVEKENNITFKLLEQKLGHDWEIRFEKEVDTMQQVQSEIETLVRKEKYIIDKEKELEKEDKGLYFQIDLTDTEKIFDVKAYEWRNINGESEMVVYFTIVLNLNSKKVTKISEVIEKLHIDI